MSEIDWVRIINDLKISGLMQKDIAKSVGCAEPTISMLRSGKRGKRIPMKLGNRLIDLHWERCVERRFQ